MSNTGFASWSNSTSTMVSTPLTTSPCCPNGSLGAAANNPEGSGRWLVAEERNGRSDMDIYVAGAEIPDAEKIVIIFTDVFGVRAGNHRIIADILAKNLGDNVAVLIPDLFRGNPAFQPWFKGKIGFFLGVFAFLYRIKYVYTFENVVKKDICDFLLNYLKSKVDLAKVGISCVGFCYGGWVFGKVIEQLAKDNNMIRCCVGMHPSWNLESMLYGGSETSMAENCGTTPVFLMPAGNDSIAIKPGGDAIAVLSSARGNIEHKDISVEFPDMKHGWVTRDDPDLDETVRQRDQEKAMRLCCEFIRAEHKIE